MVNILSINYITCLCAINVQVNNIEILFSNGVLLLNNGNALYCIVKNLEDFSQLQHE